MHVIYIYLLSDTPFQMKKKSLLKVQKAPFYIHGPSLLWAEFEMGRDCYGPSLLWAEMSQNPFYTVSNKSKVENEKGLRAYILYMHIAPFHSQPSKCFFPKSVLFFHQQSLDYLVYPVYFPFGHGPQAFPSVSFLPLYYAILHNQNIL